MTLVPLVLIVCFGALEVWYSRPLATFCVKFSFKWGMREDSLVTFARIIAIAQGGILMAAGLFGIWHTLNP